MKFLARKQSGISRTPIPLGQHNKIARYQLRGSNTTLNFRPYNKSPRSGKRPQAIENAVSPSLLENRDACT
jgi:hypothetical protein